MIDHVSIPVRDLDRAGGFYDRVLEPLGMRRMVERALTFGYGSKYPEFWLNLRPDCAIDPATGHHVALRARDKATVRQFFARALEAGGVGDGDPGLRQATMTPCFSAYIRDPDGNRVEVVTFPKSTNTPSPSEI